jgi:hypothetical protein
MTCVLEILSIHELIRRKINLLKELEKIEKELLIRNINLDQTVSNDLDQTVSNNLDQTVSNDLDQTVSNDLDQTVSNDLDQTVSNSIINKDVLNTKKKITIKKMSINKIEPKIDDTKKIKIKVNIKK